MSGLQHTSESECPTCGNDAAIVRVRGNALSAVCTRCRRVDVAPLLSTDDLLLTEGELYDAELFELEAARSGSSVALVSPANVGAPTLDELHAAPRVEGVLSVELRLPVPPR